MNYIIEKFESIKEMLNIIEGRPNNSVMKNEDSSISGTFGFTKTKSYEEAKELFMQGYTEILGEIKNGVKNCKAERPSQKRRVGTGVVGFAPHVPNAIMGVPNSMINCYKTPQKVKAINIVYNMTANCSTDAKEFVKCGIVVLGLIQTLELNGIRVGLDVLFKCSKSGREGTIASVNVKKQREHMDIQKLCFPIAHPSMFRRFGFKWLETCIGLTDYGFACGYGRSCNSQRECEDMLKDAKFLKEHDVVLTLDFIQEHDYSVDSILSEINAI